MAAKGRGEPDLTTITLQRETRDRLALRKIHPAQSFDEVLNDLMDLTEKAPGAP